MASGNTQMIDVPQLVLDALERTRDYLTPTPLEYSRYLSEQIDGEVWLKLDSMQPTSSFKYRGAVNKVMSLTDEELSRGTVAVSSGNFALAITAAMRLRGHSVPIYVSSEMEPTRIKLLRDNGVKLVIHDGDSWATEMEAGRVAKEEGKVHLAPYNDAIVIGGQGTCGYEISQQLPDLDAALFACGGGGFLTGGAGWLKHHDPGVECFGVNAKNSPAMHHCIKADRMHMVDILPTLADTCEGNIDLDSITFDLSKRHVDDFLLISEDEIAAAMRTLFYQHRLVVEGSGALTVAALLKNKALFKGKKVVPVICGRNIDPEIFKDIIA